MPTSRATAPARASRAAAPALDIHPLTPDRWTDLEELFGARGACGGCWCMTWRLRGAEYEKSKGDRNRRALKKLVDSGDPPGLLAYHGGRPVAWCAVAPREHYMRLQRSRILKPVDDQPVWSLVCFFVAKPFRRRGITSKLIEAATRYAQARGAKLVEGYPIDPRKGEVPEVFAWTGFLSAFRSAGFEEVLRRSETRPIVRRTIRD